MVCFSFFKNDILITLSSDFDSYLPMSVESISSGNVTPFNRNVVSKSLFSSQNFDGVKHLFVQRLRKEYLQQCKSTVLLGHAAVLWPEWIPDKDYKKRFISFISGKALYFYESGNYLEREKEFEKEFMPYYARCKSWLEKQCESE